MTETRNRRHEIEVRALETVKNGAWGKIGASNLPPQPGMMAVEDLPRDEKISVVNKLIDFLKAQE